MERNEVEEIEYTPLESFPHHFNVFSPVETIAFSVYSDEPIDFERAKKCITGWRAALIRELGNTSASLPSNSNIVLIAVRDRPVKADPLLHPALQVD